MSESVLGANKAPNTNKKSNAGIIVAIIVAALIIAGGVVAAILLIPQLTKGDSNNSDSSQTADDNGGNGNMAAKKNPANTASQLRLTVLTSSRLMARNTPSEASSLISANPATKSTNASKTRKFQLVNT